MVESSERICKMKYSSGNHRRGKGRNTCRSHGAPQAVAPDTEFALLVTQVEFAKRTGLNLHIYEQKMAEFLTRHPEFQQGEE